MAALQKNKSPVILIHPSKRVLGLQDNIYTYESLTPSLGLAMIGASCRKAGHTVTVADMRLPHWTLPRLLEKIKTENPTCIGIGAFTTEIIQAGFIAKAIKARFPHLPIVIGGPHASTIPEQTLEEFRDFDIAVVGEGEETFVRLLHLMNSQGTGCLDTLPGIAFRDSSLIKKNAPSREIENLDELPLPAWDLFELPHYNRWFAISASRGCPYHCYFCNPIYLGRKTRIKSPKRIVDEMEEAHSRFGISSFQFADAMLTLNLKHALDLCEQIMARQLHKKVRWECETRADSITEEMLKKMKQAGCRWIALGVETGNEEILKTVVHKGETKQQIREALRLARTCGLNVRTFFILGHYGETVETIQETIRFAIELNPDVPSFGLILPNPGTEIRRLAEQRDSGLRILNNNWMNYNQLNYDCFELKKIPLAELKKWQSRAYYTFYRRHPLKALTILFSTSVYNYKVRSIVMVAFKLLLRFFSRHFPVRKIPETKS
ncbi:MAG: radical SAM protein [Candidatus Omnitrophota bacterium]